MTRRVRWLAAALLVATASGRARAQGDPATDSVRTQGSESAERRALFKLEDDFARAVVRRDPRALHRIVAPRWVYTDESGVMNREAGIRAFTTGTDTVTRAANREMRALVYPGAAAVIGILEMTGRGPTGPFTRHYRYTDSWAFIGGRWQCIASQDYLLPDAKPAR